MEQLGYVALGCVLVLVVLGLRKFSIALANRVDWSKIRLPKFGWSKVAWTPRTKNSVLLSIAFHTVLALIGALFIVTKEVEHDAISVEWVKLPRTLRRVKTLEVKPVQPRIIPPRDLATQRVTPTAKPLNVKVAASRSFAAVRDNVDLSVQPSEANIADIPTAADIPVKSHEDITLDPNRGEAGRGITRSATAGEGVERGESRGGGGVECHRWSRQRARRIPPVWRIRISRMTNCWLTMSWALFSRVKARISPGTFG